MGLSHTLEGQQCHLGWDSPRLWKASSATWDSGKASSAIWVPGSPRAPPCVPCPFSWLCVLSELAFAW